MKKRLVTILKYCLFLGLGVFLVWWSLHQITADRWVEFKKAFATAKYWLLIPVFFILFTSHVLRALRWRYLIQPLGYNPKLLNTFFAVMIGYLANLAVPRLGEVLKCTILSQYEKVPADKLIGTIVAERAFDLVSLIIIFILAFIFQFEAIGHFGINLIKNLVQNPNHHFSLSKLLITVLIIAAVIVLIRFLLKKYAHINAFVVVNKLLKGVLAGVLSVKDLKQKWAFILCTIGIWSAYLLGTWIGFYATVGTAGLGIDAALSSLAFASIGMILTPGGIGAYAFLLAKVVEKNGVPFELGLANGTLQWFAQFMIVLFVGFISLGFLPYFNKKKNLHEKAGYNTPENTKPAGTS